MSAELTSSNERYKLLKARGEGGQGTVFMAFDLQLQRYVAIKRILKTKDEVRLRSRGLSDQDIAPMAATTGSFEQWRIANHKLTELSNSRVSVQRLTTP